MQQFAERLEASQQSLVSEAQTLDQYQYTQEFSTYSHFRPAILSCISFSNLQNVR